MKQTTKLFLFFAMTTLLGVPGISADDDIDLRVNGDFRGSTLGAATAPGWIADSLAGSTKIVQGADWDEFAIEITAPTANAKTVSSDFFPVSGKTLKLETTLRGTGSASIGFLAFDGAKKLLSTHSRMQTYQASLTGIKTKNYFAITDPNVKFIRLGLVAQPGSQVTIGDIDAEFKSIAYTPATPAQPTAQPTAPAAVAAPAAPSLPITILLPLIDNKYYSFRSIIGGAEYQVSLPVGSEIDFELGEDAGKNQYWVVSQYDANVCRVKLEHDQDGIWPLRYDKAEIELKAVATGTTRIVFSCAGKTFTVHFTAI